MRNLSLWIVTIMVMILFIVAERKSSANGNGGVCNESDLMGLNGFKSGIHLDTSHRLEKWVGQDCCKWVGISCNSETGRVTQILLPGVVQSETLAYQTEMRGTISPSISLITYLEYIDFQGLLGLTGNIPSSIGSSLPNLRFLYLSENKLNGPIPDSICKLSKIQELDLSNNLLTGNLPSCLGNLSSITDLYLDKNLLEGEITFPTSYGQLPSLVWLRLHNNNLTGKIPPTIGYLKSLKELALSNNKLEGEIPASIGNLSSLVEIYLDGNLLSGTIPKSIGKLTWLSTLLLSNNLIEGTLPAEFSSLQNLKRLDVSFNSLNLNPLPECLRQMSSLYTIGLARSGIQGEFSDFLRTTTPHEIAELDLSANNLTGSIPSSLGTFDGLVFLNISSNSLTSTIPDAITKLQRLVELDLHSNRLTGSVSKIFEIETMYIESDLRYVDLSDNKFSGGIDGLGVGIVTTIGHLNMSHNDLTGRVPVSVANLSSLKTLDISYNRFGFELPKSLSNLSSLETLKVEKNKLTGEIPSEYLKLRKLRELNVSDNILVGKIPDGKPWSDFPESSYSRNKGLCGKPLSPYDLIADG